ncbi:1293_t:CDS:2, partial [Cetraspora pellucida]
DMNSNKQDKNKSTLQQKQLDYFEIKSNIVQEENITYHSTSQNKNLSAKRIQNESTKSKIAEILQQLNGLSDQSLLKKILEDRSYTLYNDNKHVYCHSCQKSITLHCFNDGTKLKKHIITSMHLENSQKTKSKKMRITFLTTFFSNNDNNILTVIDLTKPNKELNNLVTVTVNDSQLTLSTNQSNHSFKELDTLIKNQEKHPKKYCSDNLDNLLKYYKKEIINFKYQQLVKEYSALGGLLEAVEKHGIEDWMAQ